MKNVLIMATTIAVAATTAKMVANKKQSVQLDGKRIQSSMQDRLDKEVSRRLQAYQAR